MTASIELSPAYKNLLGLRESLKEELIKLAADRDDLLHTVKHNIETDYQLKIGRKQYELFTVRVEALRLKRKMEIYQTAMNQEQKCVEDTVEGLLNREFAEWQNQARELYEELKKAEFLANLPKLSLQESNEHKKLYRELAKKFHPDVNTESGDAGKGFWLRIADAYKNGDLNELKTLALLAEDYQQKHSEPSTMVKLQQSCETFKVKIKELIRQIAGIKAQFPFDIAEKLDDAEWVRQQNEKTAAEILMWQSRKLAYAEEVEHMVLLMTAQTIH